LPELPEVESTRRGLAQRLPGTVVTAMEIREGRLRWPVARAMPEAVSGQAIDRVDRRAKYVLVGTSGGTLIIHLGMSGSLSLAGPAAPLHRHDHLIWHLSTGDTLRFRDHRRFGAVLWTTEDPLAHPLLARLGPEPLFDGEWLHRRSRGRTAAVKAFLMDAATVAGVGNIYATESLHRAGIHPARAAGEIGPVRYRRLAAAIRAVLGDAVAAGGTTFRDYRNAQGEAGLFLGALLAYGRAGRPCHGCGVALRSRVIAQRSTVFCPRCQR